MSNLTRSTSRSVTKTVGTTGTLIITAAALWGLVLAVSLVSHFIVLAAIIFSVLAVARAGYAFLRA